MNPIVAQYYSEETLKAACSIYGLKAEATQLIRDNSNLIFDAGPIILRLSHSAIRTYEDIEVELDFIEFVQQQGLPVVRIKPTLSGQLYHTIPASEGHFTTVAFDRIEGHRVTAEEWTPQHFELLGKVNAQFHKVSLNYQQKAHLKYKHWDEIIEHKVHPYLNELGQEFGDAYNQVIAKLSKLPKNDHNYGIIHYDIHHGNYLMIPGDTVPLKVFDFEMACLSWFVNDACTTIHYATKFPGQGDQDAYEQVLVEYFWKGYDTIFTIAEAEKATLPYWLLYRDLMVYGYVYKSWKGTPKMEENALFLEKTERSVRRRIAKIKW
ncbi:MAG: phosphotransferase [Bacteroidota bacterium]